MKELFILETIVNQKGMRGNYTEALKYIKELDENSWYRFVDIPDHIKYSVIDLLDCEKINYLHVEFSEDYKQFRLIR